MMTTFRVSSSLTANQIQSNAAHFIIVIVFIVVVVVVVAEKFNSWSVGGRI